MKQLIRLDEPNSFFKDEKKIEFYKDLRDNNGKVRDRWNLTTYQSDLKKVLTEISKGECAYCGNKVGSDNFDIEHYFPKEAFPYLSYSFENYLCSCKYCNQIIKRADYPKSLDDIREKVGEIILVGQIEGIIAYDRKQILEGTTDRIIEPTFDKISEHLEFEPSSCNYLIKNDSNIGGLTNRMFFNHREVVTKLQNISEQIMKMVQEGNSKEVILGWGILGYSFYIEQLYNYWSEFFID